MFIACESYSTNVLTISKPILRENPSFLPYFSDVFYPREPDYKPFMGLTMQYY